jgi:hypothetical protein
MDQVTVDLQHWSGERILALCKNASRPDHWQQVVEQGIPVMGHVGSGQFGVVTIGQDGHLPYAIKIFSTSTWCAGGE